MSYTVLWQIQWRYNSWLIYLSISGGLKHSKAKVLIYNFFFQNDMAVIVSCYLKEHNPIETLLIFVYRNAWAFKCRINTCAQIYMCMCVYIHTYTHTHTHTHTHIYIYIHIHIYITKNGRFLQIFSYIPFNYLTLVADG